MFWFLFLQLQTFLESVDSTAAAVDFDCRVVQNASTINAINLRNSLGKAPNNLTRAAGHLFIYLFPPGVQEQFDLAEAVMQTDVTGGELVPLQNTNSLFVKRRDSLMLAAEIR